MGCIREPSVPYSTYAGFLNIIRLDAIITVIVDSLEVSNATVQPEAQADGRKSPG